MSGEVRTRRWTRREYDRLIALGVLHEDERIEPVTGQLVGREPRHTPYATGVRLVDRALRRAFRTRPAGSSISPTASWRCGATPRRPVTPRTAGPPAAGCS